MSKNTRTCGARAIGLAGLGLLVVLVAPDGAWAAAGGGGGGGDWGAVFGNLGETGKAIAKVVGGLLLMGMVFWAWAERSVKSIGLTMLMAVVAGMAVSGQLWTTSTNTGSSLVNGGGASSVTGR